MFTQLHTIEQVTRVEQNIVPEHSRTVQRLTKRVPEKLHSKLKLNNFELLTSDFKVNKKATWNNDSSLLYRNWIGAKQSSARSPNGWVTISGITLIAEGFSVSEGT